MDVLKKAWDHELKIETEYFESVLDETKTFEIRKNDRYFEVNDIIKLNEITKGFYTGNSVARRISYITDYAQKDGYVVMAIEKVRM